MRANAVHAEGDRAHGFGPALGLRRLGDQPVNDRNLSEALADAVDAAPDMAEDAVGKLLFEVVRLARAAGVDPEQALQKQNARFVAGMETIPQPETPDTGA